MKVKRSRGSVFGNIFIYTFSLLVIIVTLIPFLHVAAMSLADPLLALREEIFLIPWGVNLSAYKMVFENSSFVLSYFNTIWYTTVGTLVNVLLTITLAFPMARKYFVFRRPVMIAITFTMFFSGGLVPSFIIVSRLGLYNTRWAIILPTAISTWNLIVCRTYFESIPESMIESAKIDGAGEARILARIVVPLSLPILAVLVLFYAVGHWNSYFSAILYLSNRKLQPLQIYLRRVLIQATDEMAGDMREGIDRDMAVHQLKYAAIMVSILPIVVLYPFLQRYFVQGVMIGAVKG
jgi:putative aldouronate transport system permease protein